MKLRLGSRCLVSTIAVSMAALNGCGSAATEGVSGESDLTKVSVTDNLLIDCSTESPWEQLKESEIERATFLATGLDSKSPAIGYLSKEQAAAKAPIVAAKGSEFDRFSGKYTFTSDENTMVISAPIEDGKSIELVLWRRDSLREATLRIDDPVKGAESGKTFYCSVTPTDKSGAPLSLAQVGAESIFNIVDDTCAGNSNGYTDTFDPKKFSASEEMAKMRADDEDASGVSCSDQRIYSSSRETGVEMFLKHIATQEDTQMCIKSTLSDVQRAQLKEIVSDPSNLGVFASVFDPKGDNSEACMYYTFRVFRADGTFIEFTFNYTD